MAEHQRTQTQADVKPEGREASPGAKGAQVTPMGAPLSPTGPNETEEGIIKAPPPEPPGEDQAHLIGGDPGESIQSTPPYDEPPPVREARETKRRADDEAEDKAIADRRKARDEREQRDREANDKRDKEREQREPRRAREPAR